MNKFFYNKNSTCKDMQNAGFEKAIEILKSLETFSHCEVDPILCSILESLTCYNCTPCNCLKKRIKKIRDNYNETYLKNSIKMLIAELEILSNNNKKENK